MIELIENYNYLHKNVEVLLNFVVIRSEQLPILQYIHHHKIDYLNMDY
jgi:hypothetical protein